MNTRKVNKRNRKRAKRARANIGKRLILILSVSLAMTLIAAGMAYIWEDTADVVSERFIVFQEQIETSASGHQDNYEELEVSEESSAVIPQATNEESTDIPKNTGEAEAEAAAQDFISDAPETVDHESGVEETETESEVVSSQLAEITEIDNEETDESQQIGNERIQVEQGTNAQTIAPTPVATVSPENLLNQAPLSPSSTGSASIDAYLDLVLSQITNQQMSTYDKVKAIYDYLIYHTRYDQYIYILDDGSMVPYDGDQAYASYDGFQYGYQTLYSGRGVCDTYSCAFSMLCRRIGLNSYVIAGQTSSASGGYTGHAWSVINLNGVEYVFDAQLDDQFANGGAIGYRRFFKTYDQVAGAYIPSGIKYDYMPPMSVSVSAPVSTGYTVDPGMSPVQLQDGTVFDPVYYAQTYSDVYNAFGNDANALLNHYLSCGRNEGRKPNANY